MGDAGTDELLKTIGIRTRRRRLSLGLKMKSLGERAGLSERFLSDVEAGRGNIAIGRLNKLAGALELPLTSLVAPSSSGPRQRVETLFSECSDDEVVRLLALLQVVRGQRPLRIIGLLGVRGSGKSTIGPRVAQALGLPFVELTRRIEAHTRMPLPEVFALCGEAHVRRVEQRCLSDLVVRGRPCVVALPGGIVGNPDAFRLVRESCYSIWLRAQAQDYWTRVRSQGDTRPMAGHDDAMTDLNRLLSERNPLYAQADRVVDTSGVAIDEIVGDVLGHLRSDSRVATEPAQVPRQPIQRRRDP